MKIERLAAGIFFAAATQAGAASVTSLEAGSSWTRTDMRGAGAAEIVDLQGAGGSLEANNPLPTGALKLETFGDTGDKAEVGTGDVNGLVSEIFNSSLGFSYSIFKQDNLADNASAAPALKLAFLKSTPPTAGDSDQFVQLVYEPTWNQASAPGTSQLVPTGDWTTYDIGFDSGLFWGTGGFGTPNTAGGPPLRTLEDWLSEFNADFADASLVGLSIGVGTFNLNTTGYVDKVTANINGVTTTYDFEKPVPIPVPAALPMLASALLGVVAFARRRRA